MFHEQPGRILIQTTAPDAVREAFDGVAPVVDLGSATTDGRLEITVGEQTLETEAATISDLRETISSELE